MPDEWRKMLSRAVILVLMGCAGRGWGGGGGVPGPFSVLHGRGTGCAHICFHYGHREPAFPVSCLLVWPKCRQRVWSGAGSLCGASCAFSFSTRSPKRSCSFFSQLLFFFSCLSAPVPEVSGSAATVSARQLFLLSFLSLIGLSDPPGHHQCKTQRPVSHRHSETEEAAVRTSPAMTITTEECTPPQPGRHSHHHPTEHLISTSHGIQQCT